MTCRRCGVCCRKHQAFVTEADIKRITAYLGITPDDWEILYDDSRWQFSEYRLIRHAGGACAFLKFEEGLATCTIHEVKPACCAKWQAGLDRAECREGMGTGRG
jgi:Fe-S-cluster containining protein